MKIRPVGVEFHADTYRRGSLLVYFWNFAKKSENKQLYWT